jgi:hypothetical protein
MEKVQKVLSSVMIHRRQNLLAEGTRAASQITVHYLKHLVQPESKINNNNISVADPSGRVVQGMGLRPFAC